MRFKHVVALLCVVALFGCSGMQRGYIKASEIKPMTDAVVERHNGYIDAGSEVVPDRITAFKNEADVLKAVVDAAVKGEK